MLKTSDFYYDLPEELIAQTPLEPRDSSRLLVYNRTTGEVFHRHFRDVGDYLNPGDLLVVNTTKVYPARIFAYTEHGGKVEILLLKRQNLTDWECLVKPGKKCREGVILVVNEELKAEIISRTDDGMWEMDQPWEGFDNVILASPVLKTRRMSDNGTTIEFIYTNFPDADAESALNCSYDALKFFRRLYKIAGEENTYIKFSLSASGTSGGYSRKNFITLNSGSFNEYILRNTAHEISHFWWNKAPVESWHDWLNESFAEFSALQYLRHARGEEAYAERVEMYREKTRRIRPIWGIDRADREAHTALYEKGSVLLADLLVRVGEEPFFDFLAAVIRARIADTPAFLDLAETRLGLENRNWIEQRLKQ